jgi:hypothetical protein
MLFKSRKTKAVEAYERARAAFEDARRRRDSRDMAKASAALIEAQHERLRVGA